MGMQKERAMEIAEMILRADLEYNNSAEEKESMKKILENKEKCLEFLLNDFKKIPQVKRPSLSELEKEFDEEEKEEVSEMAETIGVTPEEVIQFVIYLHSNI